VDEVTAQTVRTEAGRVECPTHLGLVLGMTDERAQLSGTVRELALVTVAARTVLLELTTQLGLVAGRVHHDHRRILRRPLRPLSRHLLLLLRRIISCYYVTGW